MNLKVCKVIFAAAAASIIALSSGICANAATPTKNVQTSIQTIVQEPLEIKAALSSSDIYEGDDITVTAAVSGGSGNYSYLFECINTDTDQNVFSEESTAPDYTFNLSQPGNYKIIVTVSDDSGLNASTESDLNVQQILPLEDDGTDLNRKRVLPGRYINAVAKFTGGVKPYQYKYILSNLSMNKVICQSDYSDNPIIRIQIPDGAPSFYRVYVIAKDRTGKTKSTYADIYSYNKSSEAISLEKSTISLTEVGRNGYVQVNSIVQGGTAPYKYLYSYKSETGRWKFPEANYVYSSTSFIRMPDEIGKYTVRVGVKDMDGNYTEKTFPAEVKELDVSKSTISSLKTYIGEGVTVKGVSRFSDGSVQYRFSYREQNKEWIYTTSYSYTQNHTFSFNKAGIYTVRVSAKDKSGKGTYKEKQFTINVLEMSVSNSSVNKTTVKTDEKIILTSRVYNNNGNVKYHYSYHAQGKPWTYIGDYKTATTQQFSFASPGIYYIRVGAKDKNGTGIYKEKQFKITVTGTAMYEDQKKFLDQARTYIGKDGAYVCKTKLGMSCVLDWCCFSVSAIMKDCGFIPQYQLDVYGVAPFPARYGDGITGTWFIKGEKTPQPGDLIFFKSSSCPIVDKYSCSHIGIVESVDGDKITTLEGNVDGGWDWAETSTYARKTHYISDTYVHSFFHINWKK